MSAIKATKDKKRRRGRPRRTHPVDVKSRTMIPMSFALHSIVEKEAKAHHRSRAGQILFVLKTHYGIGIPA